VSNVWQKQFLKVRVEQVCKVSLLLAHSFCGLPSGFGCIQKAPLRADFFRHLLRSQINGAKMVLEKETRIEQKRRSSLGKVTQLLPQRQQAASSRRRTSPPPPSSSFPIPLAQQHRIDNEKKEAASVSPSAASATLFCRCRQHRRRASSFVRWE
jgi:hypothetical protein